MRVHLAYDADDDELVLFGDDRREVGRYSTDEPHIAIKALIAETEFTADYEQEEKLYGKKED